MVTIHSPIAQLVERLTVNQNVRGSSPRRGAKFKRPSSEGLFFITESSQLHQDSARAVREYASVAYL